MEKRYSIYEAKAHLSEVIRLVKKNYQITITERGQPVAVVTLYQKSLNDFDIHKNIKDLTDAGHIKRAKKHTIGSFKGRARPGGLKRFLESRE